MGLKKNDGDIEHDSDSVPTAPTDVKPGEVKNTNEIKALSANVGETRGSGRPTCETKLNKDGTPRKRKGTRAERDKQADDLANANAQVVATMYIGLLDVIRDAIGGSECSPTSKEHENFTNVLTVYFRANSVTVPPWLQLTFITASYVAPALATKKGSGSLTACKKFIFSKFKRKQ